jgi:hypothetical protein
VIATPASREVSAESFARLRAIVLLRPDRATMAGRRLRVAAALFLCQRVDVALLIRRGSDG